MAATFIRNLATVGDLLARFQVVLVVVASAATMANVDEGDRADFAGPIDVAIRGRGAGIKVFVHGATVPLGDQQDLDDRLRRFVGRENG